MYSILYIYIYILNKTKRMHSRYLATYQRARLLAVYRHYPTMMLPEPSSALSFMWKASLPQLP